MARIQITGNNLIISMHGIRKMGTLKSELSIPLNNVKSVSLNTEAWDERPKLGEKRMGTDFYGSYFGGIFRHEGNKVFYDLKRKEDAIIIELCESDEDFSKLIIGVDNPKETITLIESAL